MTKPNSATQRKLDNIHDAAADIRQRRELESSPCLAERLTRLRNTASALFSLHLQLKHRTHPAAREANEIVAAAAQTIRDECAAIHAELNPQRK